MSAFDYMHTLHIDDVREEGKRINGKIWEWRVYFSVDNEQDYTFHETRPNLSDFITQIEAYKWKFYTQPAKLEACQSCIVVKKSEWDDFQKELENEGKPSEVISVVNVEVGFGELENTIKEITDTLEKEIEATPENIKTAVDTISESVVKSVNSSIDYARGLVNDTYTAIVSTTQSLINDTYSAIKEYYNYIASYIGSAIEDIGNFIGNIYFVISDMINNMVNSVTIALADLYNSLISGISDLVTEIKQIPNTIQNFIDNFISQLQSLIETITNTINLLIDTLKDLFRIDIEDIINFQEEYTKKLLEKKMKQIGV